MLFEIDKDIFTYFPGMRIVLAGGFDVEQLHDVMKLRMSVEGDTFFGLDCEAVILDADCPAR